MQFETQFIKNLQRFRLVTFDITDTLLRFRRAPAVQYAKTAAELGVTNIDQQRLQYCFRREFKNMSKNYPNFGCNTPSMTWQQWWIQLVKNIFHCVQPTIPPQQLQQIAETLMRLYRTSECWTHIKGGQELVQRMRDAGKLVGVISNFDASLPQILREMQLEQKFDFVLTSYDTGVQKPNARIFQIPLERCKVEAQQALHIGNILEIDYLGARNSGWSSLLVAQDINNIDKSCANAAHIFASLEDLLNALETTKINW